MRVSNAWLLVALCCALVMVLLLSEWPALQLRFGEPGIATNAPSSGPCHVHPVLHDKPPQASLSLEMRAKGWLSAWWPGNATHDANGCALTPPTPRSGLWMSCALRGDGFNNQIVTLTECMEALIRAGVGLIPGVFAEGNSWDTKANAQVPYSDFYDEAYLRHRFPVLQSHEVRPTCGPKWVAWGQGDHRVSSVQLHKVSLVSGVEDMSMDPLAWLAKQQPNTGPCFLKHKNREVPPWTALGRYKNMSPQGYHYSTMWWRIWHALRPSLPIQRSVTALLSHPDSPLRDVPFIGIHVRRGDYRKAFGVDPSPAYVAQHVSAALRRTVVPARVVYVASHGEEDSTVDDLVNEVQRLLPKVKVWHAGSVDLQAWAGVTLRAQQYSVAEQLLLCVADLVVLNPTSSWSSRVARLRAHARMPTRFLPEKKEWSRFLGEQ